jgi:hypothetical protein
MYKHQADGRRLRCRLGVGPGTGRIDIPFVLLLKSRKGHLAIRIGKVTLSAIWLCIESHLLVSDLFCDSTLLLLVCLNLTSRHPNSHAPGLVFNP